MGMWSTRNTSGRAGHGGAGGVCRYRYAYSTLTEWSSCEEPLVHEDTMSTPMSYCKRRFETSSAPLFAHNALHALIFSSCCST